MMKKLLVVCSAIAFLLSVLVFTCAEQELVVRPIDVDDGALLDAYYEYLWTFKDNWEYDGIENPRIQLFDLDLDGKPELFAETWLGRGGANGYIVKITPDGIINCYNEYIISGDFGDIGAIALCLDAQGNYGWYEEAFNAGTGLQFTTVYKVSVSPEMVIEKEPWFGYGTEQVYNEESGETDFVNTGYYVHGQEVDYDTFRREEIKRRQLVRLYSTDRLFTFPDEWDEAVNEYCVLNTARK